MFIKMCTRFGLLRVCNNERPKKVNESILGDRAENMKCWAGVHKIDDYVNCSCKNVYRVNSNVLPFIYLIIKKLHWNRVWYLEILRVLGLTKYSL